MAAELKARFTADDSDLTRKMRGIEKRVGTFGRGLAQLLSVGAIAQIGNEAIQSGKKIKDMSLSLGLPIRDTQVLQQLSDEVGASFEQVASAVAKIDNARMEALGDSASMGGKAMATLGITTKELQRLSSSEIVQRFATALRDGSQNADAQATAFDILGARGVQVQQVLDVLATQGFDNLGRSMLAAGTIMSDDTVASLNIMEAKLRDTTDKLKAFGGVAVAAFADAISANAAFFGALTAGSTIKESIDIAAQQRFAEINSVIDSINQKSGAIAGGLKTTGKTTTRISEDRRLSSIGQIGGRVGTAFGFSGVGNVERDQLQRQTEIKNELVKLNSKSSDFGVK